MTQETLLVLGAGRDQKFLVDTAKGMGLFVVGVDSDPHAAARGHCDVFGQISNRDPQAIVEFCRSHPQIRGQVNGVITMGSDIPEVVSVVASDFGLKRIPLRSAEAARDKFLMKEKLSVAGVRVPEYVRCDTKRDFIRVVNSWRVPLIIKPLKLAGSKGVFLVNGAESSDELYDKTISLSGESAVLVEKFIEGPQISTESLIIDGEVHTVGFADRNYAEMEKFHPQIMENGGWVPSLFLDLQAEIDRQLTLCARALGIRDHTLKGDVVIGKNGPVIIEVAARLSGGDFCESLVPLSTGANYVEAAIQISLGRVPNPNPYKNVSKIVVANRYFFMEPGLQLMGVDGLEEVESHPAVKKLEFWLRPGDVTGEISSHGARSGVFVVCGDNREEVQEVIDWVYETVKFAVA